MSLLRDRRVGEECGLLLVGHGTHHPYGAQQFLTLADLVAQRLPGLPVEPAFLEIQSPTIAHGVGQLLARGARRIVVVPALLFAAAHAKADVPAAVQAAVGSSPGVSVRQTPHFGLHPAILELSRRRYEQALMGQGSADPQRTCLVMVGRGSRDDSAAAEMHELARLCGEQAASAATAVAFVALAQPSLGDVLPVIAARDFSRVVVQPHLLFAGDMQLSIARQVAGMADKHPHQQWLLAPVLGDDLANGGDAGELLCSAILDLFAQALLP
jgi:sirohydrochlorin cobaltochelatase